MVVSLIKKKSFCNQQNIVGNEISKASKTISQITVAQPLITPDLNLLFTS